MRRFFVPSQDIDDETAYIRGSDVRHIRDVLRLREGDMVAVVDGAGNEYQCRIKHLAGDLVECQMLERVRRAGEPSIKITLVQGLPKGDKMDYVVQKGTEVGIGRFVPVITERTVVRLAAGGPGDGREETGKIEKRTARWRRIAMEAAKQAGRSIVPIVERPRCLDDAVDVLSGERRGERGDYRDCGDRCDRGPGSPDVDADSDGDAGGPGAGSTPGVGAMWLVPWELETARPLKGVLKGRPDAREFVVFIGPEGGFTSDEIQMLVAHGAVSVTLGPRIFRTETAGLVVAAAVLYEYGELGG
ncbi:MAG TPA: 16S rRNA (uracil(1498)-N(3))-methyltransferase [Firmicutes bacterium]|nr:16S rRNA (uracil(1498)-N(3))-methyltransferase [Bacillota bacterium]